MTTKHCLSDNVCELIVNDLTAKRGWHSAIEISLYDQQVVAARELSNTPLVVFIPLGANVKPSDMQLVLDRVRQLGVDLSTGEVTIEKHPEAVDESKDSLSGSNEAQTELSTPVYHLQSSPRFMRDQSFDRDECLRLHKEVTERQLDFELAREAEENKRARVEEIRLGLFTYDKNQEVMDDSSFAATNEDKSPITPKQDDFERTVDIHISAMFAFSDGGNICYYQATLGLAPPEFCPDDSDDEKPLDQVQQEMKKAKDKRKNME